MPRRARSATVGSRTAGPKANRTEGAPKRTSGGPAAKRTDEFPPESGGCPVLQPSGSGHWHGHGQDLASSAGANLAALVCVRGLALLVSRETFVQYRETVAAAGQVPTPAGSPLRGTPWQRLSPGGRPGWTVWVAPVGGARDRLGSARGGGEPATARQVAPGVGGLSPGRKGCCARYLRRRGDSPPTYAPPLPPAPQPRLPDRAAERVPAAQRTPLARSAGARGA
jgi:hypothetical protein